ALRSLTDLLGYRPGSGCQGFLFGLQTDPGLCPRGTSSERVSCRPMALRSRAGAPSHPPASLPPSSISPPPAPPPTRDNPFTRSTPGLIGIAFLSLIVMVCMATLPWTLGSPAATNGVASPPRYNIGEPQEGRLAPWWWPGSAGWGASD